MNIKHILFALVAGSIFCLSVTAEETDNSIVELIEMEKSNNNIYKAYFPDLKTGKSAAKSLHGVLLESNFEAGYLILELDGATRDKLTPFGFTFEVATDYIIERNERLTEIQNSSENNLIQPMMESSEVMTEAVTEDVPPEPDINGIPSYTCYETVEETFAVAEYFVEHYPDLVEWVDVGDSWEKTAGQQGYDIMVLKLTNKNIDEDKPVLFANSAIHAREYTTAALNLDFARWLIEGYGVNADATWILNHHEVHLMLHTNPDGRKRAETGLSWRKNTNQNYCSPTSNSRGADLNRNFTFTWNITNGQGSSNDPCNNTYRGASAGSEPETQAVETYVRSLWPDLRGPNRNDAAPATTSGIHIDIHSYGELVLWPWGSTSQVAPNGTELQTLGRKFAYFNGYSPEQSIGLYPTDGTTDAVSYGELGVPAYTFELGTRFFQSCSTYENTIKPDTLPALVYAAKVVRTPYVTPAGPDSTSIALSNNASTDGVEAGTEVTLTATANDARYENQNGTEPSQNISAVEYYVDLAPWESGSTAIAMTSADGTFNETVEEVEATIDTSGMSDGQHIVYVRSRDSNNVWGAISAAFLYIGEGPGSISGGFVEEDISLARGAWEDFSIDVPDGALNLNVSINGGTGDADLYVRFGANPTTGTYDCRPYLNGNRETCNFDNPNTGTYYIRLRGYRASSGVTLTVAYE